MKFVTFNLRTDTAHDGQNTFFFRAGWVLQKIDRELPDVIGFQEVRPHMLDFLRKHLPDYTFVGCGRGADFRGRAQPRRLSEGALRADFTGHPVALPHAPDSRQPV